MKVFFDRELDSVATFWRILRRDGVALGFTSHDRNLYFGGICHRAAPGMLPAAIRLSSRIDDDSAEVEGALSHDAIRADELRTGLYDAASILIGVVDWETLQNHVLYSGALGAIEDNGRSFSAEMRSAKHVLEADIVPRTSPTCRALFCGPGCGLSRTRFMTRHRVISVDLEKNAVELSGTLPEGVLDGELRFLEGPQTGKAFGILAVDGTFVTLDEAIADGLAIETAVELLEGCDHTLVTCAERFQNSKNFRGEPFLPGNDLLARYGRSTG
ncbi:MAG: DUF2163 domain-containing protein [Erythrobacter sp.]|jgi:uncharacterized phage protein (TIGR02218 family)|nr:DUF2163 domain-containing protein [Erythrobacter sp.]